MWARSSTRSWAWPIPEDPSSLLSPAPTWRWGRLIPQSDAARFEQAILAADYLLRAQRPSGLIDLPSVNIDSSPDTAFCIQALCPVIEWGRPLAAIDPAWAALLERLELFVRRSVPGMLNGGFHTPNHRWVIASALTQAQALFPDLNVAAGVEAYLAEGFDLDEDGCFIEHSIGNYDAVNDLSLLLIGEYWARPDAFEGVARNLAFDLHLLHADATAITNLSTRFDYGTRAVPSNLIPSLLLLDHHQPDPVWRAAAIELWERSSTAASNWLCFALLKAGDPTDDQAALPSDFSTFYAHNGLWRCPAGSTQRGHVPGSNQSLFACFWSGRADCRQGQLYLLW